MGTDRKGGRGEGLALGQGGVSVLFRQQTQQFSVVGHGGHDHHVAMVLGRCADQADAADVDLLDHVGLRSARRHRGLEGVQVHDHQIDGGDVVFLQLGHIAIQVTPAQDAPEDLGMQGLHPPSQDAGVGGEVLHWGHGQPESFNEGLCAAGGIKVDAQPVEFTDDGFEPVLVEHGYERALDTFLPVQCGLRTKLPWITAQVYSQKDRVAPESLEVLRKGYQQPVRRMALEPEADAEVDVQHMGARAPGVVGDGPVVRDRQGTWIHIGHLATGEPLHPSFHVEHL